MSSTISPIYIKMSVGAVVAGVLDRFVLGEQDLTQNAYFGVATGLGLGFGKYVSSWTPALIPDNAELGFTGRGIMDRSFEILGGLGGSYVLDRYISQPDNASLTSKLLVCLMSDAIAEYTSDYITTQPLQYFN